MSANNHSNNPLFFLIKLIFFNSFLNLKLFLGFCEDLVYEIYNQRKFFIENGIIERLAFNFIFDKNKKHISIDIIYTSRI